ncbi:MAG: undecaprenyl/decaprenyl-phosphate alpha-N-acetylglucosaminyl 1-phosphate transferase [Candidatus Competibacteraceae bacterium]|nr:undecaprenyl/decaprenyl-phosphate alpha-N-acetylglucosaminyl 1-phosphate transferase [Candidatus Competibacteraceae bacterium]
MEAETYLLGFGIFFGAVMIFNLLINSILLKFSTNLGMRTPGAEIRWSSQQKPSLGGFGFYIAFLLSIVFYIIFNNDITFFHRKEFIALIAACSLGFLMGLADDAYNTRPYLKFIVQFACAAILIWGGIYIQITPWEWFNYFITVFWVTGMMNSVNMLDNMDAITGIVSLMICVVGFFYLALTHSLYSVYVSIITGVGAALLAFLYYNWHPSKMYMGDSGSQFLGIFLSVIGIQLFWNGVDIHLQPIQTKQFLTVLLVFIVPIADTTTVFFNRIRKGKSPFVGGKDHTTHHLAYLGIKQRHIALLLGVVSLISGMLALFVIQSLSTWNWLYILLFSLYYIIITLALFFTTQMNNQHER